MAASEELEDESLCIYETVNTRMLSVARTSFKRRTIRSLKPFTNTANETPTFPPLLQESQHYLGRAMRHPLFVYFEAWAFAPRNWHHWRNRVYPRHFTTWRKARIDKAIESSLYHIPPVQDFVLELVKYWCPSSNTFVFPWGEVTITLEDVWVLGGYSVLGAPVSLPLQGESVETRDKILEFQIDMLERDPDNEKEEQLNWMEYFMDDEIEKKEEHDEEIEHVAFLSMWLSRFVFPYKDPLGAINRDMFSIAVHLSEGTRIALAPAVLAGVYHFMRLLKETAFSPLSNGMSVTDYYEKIAGPFELVHQWALERFPALAPPPRPLESGQPRAARWHKKDVDDHLMGIVDDLLWEDGGSFELRPYASGILNWSSHYRGYDREVVNGSGSDKDLSFGLCLCACELEGVAEVPKQKYMPHRVAKQFGIDQHFPGDFAVLKPNTMDKFSFFVPAKDYEPTESLRYFDWWQEAWRDYVFEDSLQGAIVAAQEINIHD